MDHSIDKCYLCFEEETDERHFIDPNPCNCKGTIKLHSSCAQELIERTVSCGICNNAWRYTGLKRIMYPNGTLKEETNYVNGIKEGISTHYDSEGKLIIEYNYVNGFFNLTRKYWLNSNIYCEEEFNQYGELHGFQRFYNEDGKLESTIFYENNRFTGYVNEYFQDGTLKIKKEPGFEHHYYNTGQLKFVVAIINGYYNGICKMYKKTGRLYQEKHYNNGKLIKTIKIS